MNDRERRAARCKADDLQQTEQQSADYVDYFFRLLPELVETAPDAIKHDGDDKTEKRRHQQQTNLR